MLVRISEHYARVEARPVSLRDEFTARRRQASRGVTLTIGVSVFAAVFVAAIILI